MQVGKELAKRSRAWSRALAGLEFGAPVAVTYAPLTYAREPWESYLERYARRGVETLLLGMNPGPFGMVQTGVPFGEVNAVREYLGLAGKVGRPTHTHPKRPVEGFACRRSEVSGKRLWAWAKGRHSDANHFFARFFVWNWCPLAFVSETGANLTPDKLPAAQRAPLEALCDAALADCIAALAPKRLVGVGGFAQARLERVAAAQGLDLPIGRIPHPSPASPLANRGWEPQVEAALAAFNS